MKRINSNYHRKASIVRNQITQFSQNKENLVHAKNQIQHKRIHHHFSEKIRKKINAEKLSVQPSLFSAPSLFQPSFSFQFPLFSASFSVPALSVQLQCLLPSFCFCSAPPSFFSVQCFFLFLFFCFSASSFCFLLQRLFLCFLLAPLFFFSFSPTFLKSSPKLVATQKA